MELIPMFEKTIYPDQATSAGQHPGIDDGLLRLSSLNENCIITERKLAEILGKHPSSIRRSIARNELPHPERIFGQRAFMVGQILSHFNDRIAESKKNTNKMNSKF